MKIIYNSIDFDAYTWTDPGESPTFVPSYEVCESSGELILEAENDEELKQFEDIEDWFDDWTSGCSDCPVTRPRYVTVRWNFQQSGNRMTVTVESTEPWSKEEINYDNYDDYNF